MATKTQTTNPMNAELVRIRTLIGQGKLKLAAEALNTLQAQAPTDPRIPLLGMRLAEQTGNIEGATASARRALQLAPDWHVAQIELARVLTRQQQNAEAMQLAIQALAAAPREPRVMASAINVARYAGDHEQMLKWAQDGVRRFPDDAGIRLFLARWLVSTGQHADAAEQFDVILEKAPTHRESLVERIHCALLLNDHPRAVELAERMLKTAPDDEEAHYWYDLAQGKTPPTQPRSMVARHFDRVAPGYDMDMLRARQYRLPKDVADRIVQLYPDRRFNLLDLGCGTGMLGLFLGRVQGHLIGADASQHMLQQAARHGLYSRFHHVNILGALANTPSDHYEILACLDTLPYVGSLEPVIPNALRILKPGGHFIFSCEAATDPETPLTLNLSTQRYQHGLEAVRRQCRDAGFDPVQVEQLERLRTEGGEPVAGFLVFAQKPQI